MEENSVIIGLIGLAVGTIVGLVTGLYTKRVTLKDYQTNGLIKSVNEVSPVYPSIEESVYSITHNPDDGYGGAHTYLFKQCLGYNETMNDTVYRDEVVEINFVKKSKDGIITPGLQSEQLVIALIDRTKKLNDAFPSPHNDEMLVGLQHFINASKKRINDRVSRGVMGQLKN